MTISINRMGRILFLLFTILISSACSSMIGKPTPTVEPEVDESFSPVVSATGVVVPTQWAELSMSTAGVISEILVGEDEIVRADQVRIQPLPDGFQVEVAAM